MNLYTWISPPSDIYINNIHAISRSVNDEFNNLAIFFKIYEI